MKKYSYKEQKMILSRCKTVDDIEKVFDCCFSENEILKTGLLFNELIRKRKVDKTLKPVIQKFGILRMCDLLEKL